VLISIAIVKLTFKKPHYVNFEQADTKKYRNRPAASETYMNRNESSIANVENTCA